MYVILILINLISNINGGITYYFPPVAISYRITIKHFILPASECALHSLLKGLLRPNCIISPVIDYHHHFA